MHKRQEEYHHHNHYHIKERLVKMMMHKEIWIFIYTIFFHIHNDLLTKCTVISE